MNTDAGRSLPSRAAGSQPFASIAKLLAVIPDQWPPHGRYCSRPIIRRAELIFNGECPAAVCVVNVDLGSDYYLMFGINKSS